MSVTTILETSSVLIFIQALNFTLIIKVKIVFNLKFSSNLYDLVFNFFSCKIVPEFLLSPAINNNDNIQVSYQNGSVKIALFNEKQRPAQVLLLQSIPRLMSLKLIYKSSVLPF